MRWGSRGSVLGGPMRRGATRARAAFRVGGRYATIPVFLRLTGRGRDRSVLCRPMLPTSPSWCFRLSSAVSRRSGCGWWRRRRSTRRRHRRTGRGQRGHRGRRGAAGAERSTPGGVVGYGRALVLAAPRGAVHGGRRRRPPDDGGFPDFPTLDGQPEELGEVVISYEQAKRQARQARRPVAVEVETLVVHGVLHLLGYDHAEPDEEREMFALQKRLSRERRPRALALAGAETAR